MTNYCQKCKQKLKNNAIICPNCSLALNDDKKLKIKTKDKRIKSFKKIAVTILIILVILVGISIYNSYNIFSVKKIAKDILSDINYTKIEVTKIESCKECSASFLGCYKEKTIFFCHKYYLKIYLENGDVLVPYIQYSNILKEKNETALVFDALEYYKKK